MTHDTYKSMLIQEAKKVDALLGQSDTFEKLVQEITAEQGDRATLELINELGLVVKRTPLPKIQEKQEQIIELLYKYLGAKHVDETLRNLKEVSNIPFDKLSGELYALVGLENVKQQVENLMSFNKVQRLRVENGLKKSDKTLHMAFLGNPGTGKTTVARIIGKMYKSIGLLSKGHFIEASRTDLIAEYQGQTAIKVKRLINRAKGGVLFIDEAYSITENDHSDSYGRECLTELTKALEDYRDDLVVIVAGYTGLMERFFDSNPGLKSRFNTFISFDDYTLDEMVKIFFYLCESNEYAADKKATEKVSEWLKAKLKSKDDNFANGRLVRNLFDDIIMYQSIRLSKKTGDLSKDTLKILEECDVPCSEN